MKKKMNVINFAPTSPGVGLNLLLGVIVRGTPQNNNIGTLSKPPLNVTFNLPPLFLFFMPTDYDDDDDDYHFYFANRLLRSLPSCSK